MIADFFKWAEHHTVAAVIVMIVALFILDGGLLATLLAPIGL